MLREAGTRSFALPKWWGSVPKETGVVNGFIQTTKHQKLLCFTNLIPKRRTRFSILHKFSFYFDTLARRAIIEKCIPREWQDNNSFIIESIIPRPKDGAVFVKYSTRLKIPETEFDVEDGKGNLQTIETLIQQNINETAYGWFFTTHPNRRTKVFAVRSRETGGPWLEDMNRYPSRILRVEFDGGRRGPDNLGQEALYAIFRKYGDVVDIKPQPFDSLERPRYAIVKFRNLDGATAARNCLDGLVVDELHEVRGPEKGVRLSIRYESPRRFKFIHDIFTNHANYAIPALLVLGVTVSIATFDNIRAWWVGIRLHYSNKFYRWKRGTAGASGTSYDNPWQDSSDGTTGSITATGEPIGGDHGAKLPLEEAAIEETVRKWLRKTGKPIVLRGDDRNSILSRILEDRYVIEIDFKSLGEAMSDSEVVQALAKQVKYPLFTPVIRFFDVVLNAATGRTTKSLPLESRIEEILRTVTKVIKKSIDDSEEEKPVILIRNIVTVREEGGKLVFKLIEKWAAQLSITNHAHLVVLTNTSALKSRDCYREDLPSSWIADASSDATSSPPRLSSLAQEIITSFLTSQRPESGWTIEQAWLVIKKLCAHNIEASDSIAKYQDQSDDSNDLTRNTPLSYSEVALHDIFKFCTTDPIKSLEKDGLIRIEYLNGLPYTIHPSPRYSVAHFKELLNWEPLALNMDIKLQRRQERRKREKIRDMETELQLLGELKNVPKRREAYLIAKIEASQHTLEQLERKRKICKAKLKDLL